MSRNGLLRKALLTDQGGWLEDTLDSVIPQSETDILLLAPAEEKKTAAPLAVAEQARTEPKALPVYNHPPLEEVKHLLTLVTHKKDLANDWFAHLDRALPPTDLSSALPHREDANPRFAIEEEPSEGAFRYAVKRADREELSSLLEHLRADEEVHRRLLLSLQGGMEADRPVVAMRRAVRLQSIRPAQSHS